jgi:hypothetical protein
MDVSSNKLFAEFNHKNEPVKTTQATPYLHKEETKYSYKSHLILSQAADLTESDDYSNKSSSISEEDEN